MAHCPECGSFNVDLLEESEVRDDGQGYYWTDTSTWYCNDCECEFEKIETTEVEYEVTKHGKEYEE